MPHLHWETDRQREEFTLEIQHFTESWKNNIKTEEEDKKGRVEKGEAAFRKSSPPRPAQPSRGGKRRYQQAQVVQTLSDK
jgi:hypothetical protein